MKAELDFKPELDAIIEKLNPKMTGLTEVRAHLAAVLDHHINRSHLYKEEQGIRAKKAIYER